MTDPYQRSFLVTGTINHLMYSFDVVKLDTVRVALFHASFTYTRTCGAAGRVELLIKYKFVLNKTTVYEEHFD